MDQYIDCDPNNDPQADNNMGNSPPRGGTTTAPTADHINYHEADHHPSIEDIDTCPEYGPLHNKGRSGEATSTTTSPTSAGTWDELQQNLTT